MRFRFQELEDSSDSADSQRSPTPKESVRWLPLKSHPVFGSLPASQDESGVSQRFPKNFMAWDEDSRLYCWDSKRYLLHRLSLRLGEPEQTSVLAAVPSKVLQPDIHLTFSVNKISINKSGSAVLLAGSDGICVMYLSGRASAIEDTLICRTVSIGSEIYSSGNNVIQLLQASWHPDSDIHLGILSSDAVFRLFDMSADVELPEQEYYLQSVEPGRSGIASSVSPTDFSFGGDHLWDNFTVFILFTDGSIYILCPVVPFGSFHKWESIIEIYNDAHMFGLKSSDSIAVSNSNLAIDWLEAVFPDLTEQGMRGENILVVKAHPYALLDASLALQGPLYKVFSGEGDERCGVREAERKGRAVSLLYNLISKDSILVTAWSGGQLHVDALVDEIQPVWISSNFPRLRMNSHNKIQGVAMICESNISELPPTSSNQSLDHTVWLGHPPPLLRLAMVDLALPTKPEGGSHVTLFADSLVPERIYSFHDGVIDSTVLHSLPFTSQATGRDDTLKTPSVHTVLSTSIEESAVPSLIGFVPLSDSLGYAWVIALLSTGECIVLEMKSWDHLLAVHVSTDTTIPSAAEAMKEQDTSYIISKELLAGPIREIPPLALPKRSVPANSVEARSILHPYLKLFHENYVVYARKVHFEMQHHSPKLKKIIDDQQKRLAEAQVKMSKVENNQSLLEERMEKAIQRHNSLEQRLQHLRSLPKKPLTRAERDFKSELDQFTRVEMDVLESSIKTVKARLKKSAQKSPKGRIVNNTQKKHPSKNDIQDTEMSLLQSTLSALSLVNSDNSKKVKIVESALKSQESNLM